VKMVQNRNDLLCLSPAEDRALCAYLREFLVEHVAQTGGHLASNLGVVELTVALHKVYNSESDRILFDVGHQAYIHKLLTGRMEQFHSLRTFGGLAGFPKPSESVHDAFIAGHASDAVSVALGMARARTLQKESYQIVAVLGDGALTGGLAYEGLNDAGASHEPMVVVLNDNGMSIASNVGGVSKHLCQLRLKPAYLGFKKAYRKIMNKLPGGKQVYRVSHRMKNWLRRKLLDVTLFEEMGFQYLGPVDGHDIGNLTFLLKEAKEMGRPVLLHVITKKGKGYAPAEVMPASFHGVGKFDPNTGLYPQKKVQTFSETFGSVLCDLAEENERICGITAAMEQGTGLSQFAAKFQHRFFDVGIAEGHAVCMAAGLAKQGAIPVFAVYSTFLQRSYDMLVHDVSLLGLHVVLAVDRAGLVGEDGETHHGVFDVSFLRQIPGMTVLCPASQLELKRMLRHAVLELDGPVAVRYPKGTDGCYKESEWTDCIRDDAKITMVTYGTTVNDLLLVSERLLSERIPCDVIKLDQIQPLDLQNITRSVLQTGRLLFVEESAANGSIGEAIAAALLQQGVHPAMKLLNLGDGIVPHGDLQSLRSLCHVDVESIYETAKELLKNEA